VLGILGIAAYITLLAAQVASAILEAGSVIVRLPCLAFTSSALLAVQPTHLDPLVSVPTHASHNMEPLYSRQLVHRIHCRQHAGYWATGLVAVVSGTLADQSLTQLAQRYLSIAYPVDSKSGVSLYSFFGSSLASTAAIQLPGYHCSAGTG
jgi:hypothetical protein